MSDARLVRIHGALVEARPAGGAGLYELARVGERGLLAEVVRLDGDTAMLQVHEETTGLRLGEPVRFQGGPLVAELGPGLLGSILDGIGRPLRRLAAEGGVCVEPGAAAPTLDRTRHHRFRPAAAAGGMVRAGDVLGEVEEQPGFTHLVLIPPGMEGRLERLGGGEFTVEEPIGRLTDGRLLRLMQTWPVRRPRPVAERTAPRRPFVTGQRVLDLLVPVMEGGSVAVPGGFGTGKTVLEQSLAKFAEADVVVFVGCGERGNEIAEVLDEFPRLTDPLRGRPLLERMVVIANTSNMPVAAREASVELGFTIAEYYRDMGRRTAVMADSLSRWAEALREIGARLQEMPGEEGYPTALGNRLGKVCERAGAVRALGSPAREGSITFISAVSPPGGDLSEPVTQASLRVSGALWALDTRLAQARQFPAIDWETSFSLYAEAAVAYFAAHVDPGWPAVRTAFLGLLQREAELKEIAGLVGPEALQDGDRLLLEDARLARAVVLGQSAHDPRDAFSPPARTHRLAALAIALHEAGRAALAAGIPFERLDTGPARQALVALRGCPEEEFESRARFAAGVIAAGRGARS